MNHPRVAGSWEEILPLDVVGRQDREHLGLVYPGESVLARSWQAYWAGPLTGDCYFRIVLLDQRLNQEIPTLEDARIAVCLPAAGTSRNLDRLRNELDTIRQAAYLTRHSADAATVARSLEERRAGLDEQVTEERRSLFASGTVLVNSRPGPDPAWVFSGGRPQDWLDRLSGWVLEAAYPTLPVNFGLAAATLERPLHGGDAGLSFASRFAQPGSDPEIWDRLGPALKTSTVPALIRARTSNDGGTASYAEMHRYLAHDVGLTGPWANLVLLLFLHGERPELETGLAESHGIKLADGRPLSADRLTCDLVPSLAWAEDLELHVATIGPLSSPSFAAALQHLSALCPEIGLENEAGARDLLARRLSELREGTARSQEFLERLRETASALGPNHARGSSDATPSQAISRIGKINGDAWPQVYASIRETYPDLRQLEADLETIAQLARLSLCSQEIFAAQAYLAGAKVPEDTLPALGVDKQALWAALSPGSLLNSIEYGENGRSWEAVSRELSSFKGSYAGRYRGHHQSFYDALPRFQSELEGANLKLRALGLLNTLAELGPPEGEGLGREIPGGALESVQCSQQTCALELTDSPVCPECRLSLAETLPTEQLERLLPRVDRALSAKTRALSGQLVSKVLNGGVDTRMRDFLAIVKASELSGLANTLDEELLDFVRRVLD